MTQHPQSRGRSPANKPRHAIARTKEGQGSALKPARGLCPLDPPPKAEPLGSIHFVWVHGRGDWAEAGQPPLAGIQGAAPLGGVRGKAPPFSRFERLHGAACLRVTGPSARRRGSRDCDTVTPTGGAQYNGRTQAKDLAVTAGHATQPPGAAERGARRVPQLRRVEAPASCLQPLRPLRRARGCCGRQDAEGRDSRLTPGRGARASLV